MTKIQRNPMRARQRIGTKMASRAMIIDPTNSKVETKGFPIPVVEAEDVARSATVVPCTNPAIPPPAISASVHFRNGDISVTIEAVAMVPAMIAAGVATISIT
jgi:hypothetical protein